MKVNWNDICERFGPMVWATAFRVLKCESDAVDCYQEVLLAAFEFSKRETVANWGGYLKWLATRRAIDLLRKRSRREDRQDTTDVANLAARVEQGAELHDLVEALRNEVAQLSPQQGEAFWLVAVEQLSYADVAEQLNVQPNHVGVLVHRARRQLQRKLKGLVLDASNE